MSGIIGILNLNGAPVDRDLLRRMTDFMVYRGPDAQEIWSDGNVGFGHAMLRTTDEPWDDRQPCTLDGCVWITADARIDARADLIRELTSRGRTGLAEASDVHLILHAYHAWGEDCVHHLLGDFAFAIWDGNRRQLFCARDHFGVKPFYYAHLDGAFIFSNTLECVRLHPTVSDELNDEAIGDFLLGGFNFNEGTTTFADIQRIPGAHCLTCCDGESKTERYWQVSIPREVRYRRAGDYIEHFSEHLRNAVADRLRTERIAVQMSGGLDSTTLAATALEVSSKSDRPLDLQAFTLAYDRLMPCEERHYATLVAQRLGIPIHVLPIDDYGLYDRYDQPDLYRPEPVHHSQLALTVDHLKQVASHSRVAMTGDDGDCLLNDKPSWHFRALARNHRFLRFLLDMGRHVYSERDVPRIGLRKNLRRWLGMAPKVKEEEPAKFPTWINPDFAERCRLRTRWEEINRVASDHPRRPLAFQVLTLPVWSEIFESYDPGVTSLRLEFRHPLMDLRLVNYLLSVPPVPWCTNKKLVRLAMRGILPEPVLCRPKTKLAAYPRQVVLRNGGSPWVDRFESEPELASYVKRTSIPALVGEENAAELSLNLRPLSLNCWFHNSKRHRIKGGASNDRFTVFTANGTNRAPDEEELSEASPSNLRQRP